MVIEITDANFQQEVSSKANLVAVEIWASWNSPSVSMHPVLEQLATEYAGHAVIGKLNLDNNPNVPAKYNVRSVPAFLFFKNGQVVVSILGTQTKEQLKAKIDANL